VILASDEGRACSDENYLDLPYCSGLGLGLGLTEEKNSTSQQAREREATCRNTDQ
jgi:hypothetical protein